MRGSSRSAPDRWWAATVDAVLVNPLPALTDLLRLSCARDSDCERMYCPMGRGDVDRLGDADDLPTEGLDLVEVRQGLLQVAAEAVVAVGGDGGDVVMAPSRISCISRWMPSRAKERPETSRSSSMTTAPTRGRSVRSSGRGSHGHHAAAARGRSSLPARWTPGCRCRRDRPSDRPRARRDGPVSSGLAAPGRATAGTEGGG
jgi:hypothetical protein